MIRPNEIALTPASLATDGEQGEGAKAGSLCEAEHSPQERRRYSWPCRPWLRARHS